MRRTARTTALVTGTALVVGTAGAAVLVAALSSGRPATHDVARASGNVIIAHGADRRPSQTAQDWVTYADHLVEVTPVIETEIPPTQEELDRGEGVILRKVGLRVDRVLWSRNQPAQAAPTSFDWTAYGWQFTDGSMNNRTEMAGEDQPRIETGHRYVMALEWVPPRCDPDDGRIPGQWRGLGSESTIPYDDGVLGQGEFQGGVRPAGAARAALSEPESPDSGLRDEFTGRSAEELARRLGSTEPRQTDRTGLVKTGGTELNCP